MANRAGQEPGAGESGTTIATSNGTTDSPDSEEIPCPIVSTDADDGETLVAIACGQVVSFLCATIHESNQPPKNLNNILKRRFY
jgi:hypothetical protein